MRISDWSSDVCSSDLLDALAKGLSQWYEWRNSRAAHGVAAGAAIGHHVVAEESAAVIDDCLVPLQLVETFDGELVGQALGGEQHIYRDQAFLDLGTRTAERGDIHRVDAVDGVADEGTFTPTDRSEEHTSELQSIIRTSYA